MNRNDDGKNNAARAPVFGPTSATLKTILATSAMLLMFTSCGYETPNSSARNTTRRASQATSRQPIAQPAIPWTNVEPSQSDTVRLGMDRIRERQPQPDKLEEGLEFSTVEWLLITQPAKLGEFATDEITWTTYEWHIGPSERIIAKFKNDQLHQWWTESDEIEAATNSNYDQASHWNIWERAMIEYTEIDGLVYPMAVRATIRGTTLSVDLYDTLDYVNAAFMIGTGGETYWYRLEFLPGAKITRIELDEFNRKGWRFSPYSQVAETLMVVATRPDGNRSFSMTVFSGNTRE